MTGIMMNYNLIEVVKRIKNHIVKNTIMLKMNMVMSKHTIKLMETTKMIKIKYLLAW